MLLILFNNVGGIKTCAPRRLGEPYLSWAVTTWK